MISKLVTTVPIDRLRPDPNQPRKTFPEDSLRALAMTLTAGQIQPILVYPEGDDFVIIDGERRWRALTLAGSPTADIIVADKPPDRAERLRLQLIANVQREDVPPLEKAEAVHLLIEATQSTAAEIAEEIGVSEGQLSKLLALRTADANVRQAVASGQIGLSAAYELARLDDVEQRQVLLNEAAEGRLTRDALTRKIKRLQRVDGSSSDRAAARVTAKLDQGRTVTVSGSGLSLETLVACLEELLAKARKARSQQLGLTTFVKMLRDQNAATKSKGAAT